MLGIDPKTARSAFVHAVIYAAVALLIFVIWVIRKTLLVFATALMFAYLLYPLVDELERRLRWKTRTLAVALPFALIFSLLATFILVVNVPLTQEYNTLYGKIKEKGFVQEVADWRPGDVAVGQHLVDLYNESDIAGILPRLSNALRSGARYLFNFFIIPILSFFILKDGRRIRDSLLELFDDRRQVERVLRDAHFLLLEYMRSLLLLCVAVLVCFSIALSLLHVPYAIILSLIAFPLEFVPLVGPLASAAIIIGVSGFNHYQNIGLVIAFLIGYRLFQDYVLSPHLMKKGVNLHPLLVLFGVFAGGEIGSVPGIFLSIPLLALMRLAFYEWRKRDAVLKAAASA